MIATARQWMETIWAKNKGDNIVEKPIRASLTNKIRIGMVIILIFILTSCILADPPIEQYNSDGPDKWYCKKTRLSFPCTQATALKVCKKSAIELGYNIYETDNRNYMFLKHLPSQPDHIG